MRVQLLKFIVQPVMIEFDDNDLVVGERVGEPQPAYGVDALIEYAESARRELAEAKAAGNGGVILPR
jgi:hypothetical protein